MGLPAIRPAACRETERRENGRGGRRGCACLILCFFGSLSFSFFIRPWVPCPLGVPWLPRGLRHNQRFDPEAPLPAFAKPVGITATGQCYPDRVVTNDDLSKLMNQRRMDPNPHGDSEPTLGRAGKPRIWPPPPCNGPGPQGHEGRGTRRHHRGHGDPGYSFPPPPAGYRT